MSEAAGARKLWERMPKESDRAFAKFCAYRDMGAQRSLVKLRQPHKGEKGWTRRAVEDLCERRRWVSRAAAWDDEQDRARLEAQNRAIAEMTERQARDGLDMQKLARGAMTGWVTKDPQTGQFVLARELSPSETVRLYRVGFDVERMARGEPTERAAVQEEQLPWEEQRKKLIEMRELIDEALHEEGDEGAQGKG